jgi:hypothetical protein
LNNGVTSGSSGTWGIAANNGAEKRRPTTTTADPAKLNLSSMPPPRIPSW